jgi:hypothetical protein
MDGLVSTSEIETNIFQHELTNDERALRDRYVSEYLKDYDVFQAALRTGFQLTFALDWGKRLHQDGYVQSQIATLTRRPAADPTAQEIEDRALLENTYREVMQRGSGAARVAAGRAFAAMKGWEKPDGAADTEETLSAILRTFAAGAPV